MPVRRRLPHRRRSENFPISIPGLDRSIVMTVGYYADGSPGECFISDVKAGTSADAITRDAAVLLSMCMQYGVPLDAIDGAVTRESDGSPSSAVGVLIGQLVRKT